MLPLAQFGVNFGKNECVKNRFVKFCCQLYISNNGQINVTETFYSDLHASANHKKGRECWHEKNKIVFIVHVIYMV